MGEFWNHRKNWVTKEAACAAHIYGKKLVNSESFTGWQNWQDGPAGYKRLLDIALCAGLNQVTFHTFAHEPPVAGKPGFAYHAGEHFNVNSTWWNQDGPMIEDMSRCCYMLQQGLFVADVCAYYGDEAPNLVPARRITPTIKPGWTDDKCLHCGKPIPVDLRSLGHGHDYDYVNEEVILTRMKTENGKLVLPDGMNYRLLVLPNRETISLAVLRRVGELVETGATIVGPKPQRSNSLQGYPDCDRDVRELANRIWGPCDGDKVRSYTSGKGKVIWNIPLEKVMEEMGVAPDFVAENMKNDDRKIGFIHRATPDEDIYFVSNSSMDHQSVQCRFRVSGGRTPNFWNAEDGSVKPCHVFETGEDFVRIPIELAPASSAVVLDLGVVKEVATVKVNGKDAGILWKEPYRMDIGPLLKTGDNQLEIAITNLWNNRIVGDLQPDSKGTFSRTNIKSKFRPQSLLLPSGLIGPVTLDFPVSVTAKSD